MKEYNRRLLWNLSLSPKARGQIWSETHPDGESGKSLVLEMHPSISRREARKALEQLFTRSRRAKLHGPFDAQGAAIEKAIQGTRVRHGKDGWPLDRDVEKAIENAARAQVPFTDKFISVKAARKDNEAADQARKTRRLEDLFKRVESKRKSSRSIASAILEVWRSVTPRQSGIGHFRQAYYAWRRQK